MEMLEDPETEKKQREGRRCLSRAANIDKAGPPPSLPSSSAHHTSPEKKGGASPKHQWKREWAGSRLGAGGGACPAGPMRTRGAGRLLGREGRRMADAALFEFLHTEMVAELWAQDPDPGPGGQKMSLSVLEGMGFRVGQALGESLVSSLFLISGLPPPLAWAPPQAAPRDASLQGGAGRPQVPMQRRVGGRVPKADGQPPHQSSGDLRPAGPQLPPSHPDGLGSAVPGGSAQVPGLHLRPPTGHPQHPGHQEPGHRLRGSPARL
ncbi:trafficking protein particle complex subunit 6A isoform X3 [Lagenorhynchus albirostris]|uniref:trafficking protein particle complex subunit 6A isoform X3 n=1 Tax=Lagenorhynchus albirostris TaxID=27610 RepID=UPI0028F16201|nr:trafficking protein particle complex subunit 6A isoform X3 [Lagenorhynchus albirostris]